MILCLHCSKSTSNPKFCNRSCAATYNNTHKISKSYPKICKCCSKQYLANGKNFRNANCPACAKSCEYLRNRNRSKTVAQIKQHYAGKSRPWSDLVRGYARSWFSSQGKICVSCGYAKHVEVCHIKPIVSFPNTALVSEINNKENITYLCPNCHWEFDNL